MVVEVPWCLQLIGEALLCPSHCSFSDSSLHEVIFSQPIQLTHSLGLGRKADNAECSQPRGLGRMEERRVKNAFICG